MPHRWLTPESDCDPELSVCAKCGLEFKVSREGRETFRAKGEAEFTQPANRLRPKCIDAPKPEPTFTLAQIEAACIAASVTDYDVKFGKDLISVLREGR